MNIITNIFLYVIPFILVIGAVITIHELGHYWAARLFGTKIESFAIGFGRPLAQWWDKRGVHWRVGWIPIGGYVRYAGDENAASIPDLDDLAAMRRQLIAEGRGGEIDAYFHFKPVWQRALIVLAGPFANFLMAIFVFAGLLLAFGEPVGSTRVDTVEPGGAAAAAGFRPGDVVLRMDGREVESFDQIRAKVVLSSDTPIQFVVKRGEKDVAIIATPRRGAVPDRLGRTQQLGKLGFGHINRPGDIRIQRYTVPQALAGGLERTADTITSTLTYIKRLFQGRETAEHLAGPLGMAQMSGDLAKEAKDSTTGVGAFAFVIGVTLIEFIGIISVGIGFMNLLPVPVLDGGHMLFYAYEAIARRPLAAKVQMAGYRVGLALVLGLMLFATWNDLHRLRVFNLVGRLFS